MWTLLALTTPRITAHSEKCCDSGRRSSAEANGSGPGHKLAFENAMAHVGCPDRRIDRLCITCCSPSQPSHYAMVPGAISLDPQPGWIIVSLASSHHRPGHSGELVGQRDGSDFGRPSCQQCCDPGAILGAMELGIADDSECAGHEQAAQIAVSLFADAAELCPPRSSAVWVPGRSRPRSCDLIERL